MSEEFTESQRRYRALQQQFRSSLPDRLREIIRLGENWLTTETSAVTNGDFQQRVHDLAGSAGSYGFPEITQLCKKIEEAIRDNQAVSKEIIHTWLNQLQTFIK